MLAVLGHPRGALQQRCGLLLRYEAVEKGESGWGGGVGEGWEGERRARVTFKFRGSGTGVAHSTSWKCHTI